MGLYAPDRVLSTDLSGVDPVPAQHGINLRQNLKFILNHDTPDILFGGSARKIVQEFARLFCIPAGTRSCLTGQFLSEEEKDIKIVH